MRSSCDIPLKAAVIVAHPDDEAIWCGGLILTHPDWDWTVLSLCRRDDPDRGPKFQRACRLLHVRGFISDLDDSNPLVPVSPRREIGRRIMETIGSTCWDLCVTHGRNGEYGHRRHKETHAEVLGLIESGILDCGKLWTFAYDCDEATGICRPGSDADVKVELTDEQFREKKRIVCEEYGFGRDSFEARACITPECFGNYPLPDKE